VGKSLRASILTAVVAFFVIGTAAAADDYELPSIGQPADSVLSPAEERRIGERVIGQMRQRGMILDDPQVTHYIRRVGWRLASHSDRAPSRFNFFVIADRRVNAFALPGGFIGINAGLILESGAESELAGVMAHEIAHVTQRHIARQIEATQGVGVMTAAAMLLAILASGGNPAVVEAAVTMGMANIGQQQINYTRQHELEADRLGIRTLAAAGYNPDGMSGFFHRMQRRSRLYGNQLPEILLTHPVNTTRISEAESRAREYRNVEVNESTAYPYMRARTRVVTSNQPSDSVVHFQEKRNSDQSDAETEYGYGIALLRVGRADRAVEVLQPLHTDDAEHPYIAMALAEAKRSTGEIDTALAMLDDASERFPSYEPLKLARAELQIAAGEPQKARDTLMTAESLLGSEPEAHRLLGEAAADAGRTAEAHYRRAQYFDMRGQYAAAIHQLKAALRLDDLSANDKARLRAAMQSYRQRCAQQLSEDECRKRVAGKGRGR